MNKFLLFLGLAALLATPLEKAHAYSSVTGADPRNGSGNFGQEIETKQIVKSGVAGASQALIPGVFVMYDKNTIDGYTVTRAISQDQYGIHAAACLNLEAVATGDTQYHPCAVKGLVFVQYDGSGATTPIEQGRPACFRSDGVLRGCYLANAIEATGNSGVVPLKSATDSGSALPVIINLQ